MGGADRQDGSRGDVAEQDGRVIIRASQPDIASRTDEQRLRNLGERLSIRGDDGGGTARRIGNAIAKILESGP